MSRCGCWKYKQFGATKKVWSLLFSPVCVVVRCTNTASVFSYAPKQTSILYAYQLSISSDFGVGIRPFPSWFAPLPLRDLCGNQILLGSYISRGAGGEEVELFQRLQKPTLMRAQEKNSDVTSAPSEIITCSQTTCSQHNPVNQAVCRRRYTAVCSQWDGTYKQKSIAQCFWDFCFHLKWFSIFKQDSVTGV